MSQTSDISQQTAPTCTLGLTSADLSAWRDEALEPNEMARIGAHSESCPACQQRLRGFALVAATLQAQQVPAPDERLWQAVLASISSTERRTTGDDSITSELLVPDQSGDRNPNPIVHSPTPPRSWRRRALGTLAAVAAIALVVVGFGRLFQFGASNRPQPFQVHWRQVTLPDAISTNPGAEAMLSVFPADGSIAWLCQAGTKPAPRPLRLWRTSDGGATWRAAPTPTSAKAFECQITTDQLSPDAALLHYGYITTTTPAMTQGAYAITFDGGVRWQDGSSLQFAREFATHNGATYALRQTFDDSNSLEVSTDGGMTWNSIDNALHSQKFLSDYFWVNPTSGSLLIEAHSIPSPAAGMSFWATDDHGATWRKVGESPPGDVTAIPTSDGQGWSICTLVAGVSANLQHPDFRSHVHCGTDTSSWSERSGLDIPRSGKATPSPCAGCGDSSNAYPYGAISLVGVGNDGAVLTTVENRFNAKGEATQSGLYRLPAGSSQWQNGGETPGTPGIEVVTYAPRPSGGILWSMPTIPLDGQTPAAVFTASYPGPAAPPLPTQTQQTPTPTGNVAQGAPLAWQPIATPTGFQPRLTSSNILAVAPSDGRIAYACAQPNANPPATQPHGWVTHDGGASWSTLPLPQVTGWCSFVLDEVDPRDVLLGISQDPPAGGTTLPDRYYRSADGGNTWQHVGSLDGSLVLQFATHGGALYALRITNPLSDTATAELQASTDGMATWHIVDGAIRGGKTSVDQFWLNPYNGALLATNVPPSASGAAATTTSSTVIWRSGDGGAHWRDLRAPTYGFTSVIVRPPQPNQTWDICVSSFLASPTTAPSNLLYCGDDSGQGWHDMIGLDSGDASATPRYPIFTSDGALLAITMTTTGSGATTYSVYRLPSGANRWQALGPTPEYSILYASAEGSDGVLWSVPAPGIVADAQGRIFAVAAP